MGYEVHSFAGFGGGLNLRDKPDVIDETQAIDSMNVIYSETGAVSQRFGYGAFTTVALTERPASLAPYYTTSGAKHLLAGCGTRLEAVSSSGAVIASQTPLSDGIWDFCRFGAPGSELAYANNGVNVPQKWDGAAWTALPGQPKGRYQEVMAVDQGNRMVVGGFDDGPNGPLGLTASTSTVWWSQPGNPESFGQNDFDNFTPGDGEKIQNIVAWRELVIVFKETKFFVVYGTDTDAAGNPIFRYTTIDTGVGLASPRAVAVGTNAVYFMSRNGVYRTTGQDPELVSAIVQPIWAGDPSPFYTGGAISHGLIGNCAMGFHDERLYLAFSSGADNDRVLIFDPRYEWWSLWDIPASCFASFRIGNQSELVFGYASGSNDIGRYSSAYTNDAGVATTAFWRAGWGDYGLSVQKRVREKKIWGYGDVSIGLATDFDPDPGTLYRLNLNDPNVDTWDGTTWGGGEWAIPRPRNPKLERHAARGTVFSPYFHNDVLDTSFTIARLDLHLPESRVPSFTAS